MRRSRSLAILLVLAAFAGTACSGGSSASEAGSSSAQTAFSAPSADTTEWVSQFDGQSLEGWHVHEGLPGEQLSGGDWSVEEGVIVGTQGPLRGRLGRGERGSFSIDRGAASVNPVPGGSIPRPELTVTIEHTVVERIVSLKRRPRTERSS